MTVHHPGVPVVGKTKKTRLKHGTVVAVFKDSRLHTYDVRWGNGVVERVSARSIAAHEATEVVSSSANAPESSEYGLPARGFATSPTGTECPLCDCEDPENDAESAIVDEENVENLESGELADGYVIANERLWSPCSDVLKDVVDHVTRRAAIHWPEVLQLGVRSAVKYFYLFYPMQTLQATVAYTNHNLQSRRKRSISEGDLLRWIGLRLTMAIEPREGPLRVYWERDTTEGEIGTPANFGEKYGMSRHAFEEISTAFSLVDSTVVSDDTWFPIRGFLDAFTERKRRVISPGEMLVVDECMSGWDGLEYKHYHNGIPHKTKIPRKPVSQGAEIKAIADGETGILLGLELMEGAQQQRNKRYHRQFGEGTAITLRLAEHYKGTGRTVVADSAFASVKTLIQLQELLGLHFMGMVKTATKEFPKRALEAWYRNAPVRGSFRVYVSRTPKQQDMYALCWADRKPKMIISNRGTTPPGNDSIRSRHRKIVVDGKERTEKLDLHIPRPHMIELFFSRFSAIDVHDHYRQGSLRLEREWSTRTWWHRLFSTLIGMVVTDAYLAYRHLEMHRGQSVVCDFSTFKRKLAYELIFNDFLKGRSTRDLVFNEVGEVVDDGSRHKLLAFVDLPQYTKVKNTALRAQRRCKMCQKRCSYYCGCCSQPTQDTFVALCGFGTKRNCHAQHVHLASS